jgi:hypothetical protein
MGLSPASHMLPPFLKVFQSQAPVFTCRVQCLLWRAVVAGQCVSITGCCLCGDVTLQYGPVTRCYKPRMSAVPSDYLYDHQTSCIERGTAQVGLSGFSLDHIPSIVASFVWLYPSRQMSVRPLQKPQPPPFKFLPVHYS